MAVFSVQLAIGRKTTGKMRGNVQGFNLGCCNGKKDDIPQAPSRRRYPALIASYTTSAQLSLTFQRPKPIWGMSKPLLSLMLGTSTLAIVTVVVVLWC